MCPQGSPTDLSDIIEVPMWRCLLGEELLICIEHCIEVELLLKQHKSVVSKALDRPQGAVTEDTVHLGEKIGGRTRDLRRATSMSSKYEPGAAREPGT